jgi:ribosomal protein S27AE
MECGIDKQIAKNADEPEAQECSKCFSVLLSEDVECGLCGSCQYVDSANADHLTENQFPNV